MLYDNMINEWYHIRHQNDSSKPQHTRVNYLQQFKTKKKGEKKIDNEKQTGGQKFQGKYRKKRIWAKKGRMEASDG